MNNEITTEKSLDIFIESDKNMAELIKAAYEQGVYTKTLEEMSTQTMSQQYRQRKNKTFHTHQDIAYMDIYSRELSKRAGHPNESISEEIDYMNITSAVNIDILTKGFNI